MKKLFGIVFLCLAIILFTGCERKEEDEVEKDPTTFMAVYDSAHNYYTSFPIDEESDFTFDGPFTNLDSEGFNHNVFKSDSLGIKIEGYHREGEFGTFEKLKAKYEKTEGYREYTWNGNPGITYNTTQEEVHFVFIAEGYQDPDAKDDTEYDEWGNPIITPDDIFKKEVDKEILLYGDMTCLEEKKCNASTIFRKKDIQNLLRKYNFGYIDEDF